MLSELESNTRSLNPDQEVNDTISVSALNALNDGLLLLDAQQQTVIWTSNAFGRRFSQISEGTGLELLYTLFTGLESVFGSTNSTIPHEKVNTQVTLNGENPIHYNLEVMPLDTDRVLLRFKDRSAQKSEVQRYLQDREKLFSTSRTISVSEMATTLAHEINQPIGTIKNLLTGIRNRLQTGENIEETIVLATDRAIEQTQFAARIISRIRDYTQARTPEKESLDLIDLVRECVSLLDWEIDHQDVSCEYALGSDRIMISGDSLMLQQVFVNLMRNAIDAMRDLHDQEKRLLITSSLENGLVTISVEDSGCGLTSKVEKKLFQPFVSTKPTGMGVGLNICRSFIELHQGRLWLTANEPLGCTAYVSLPVLQGEEK